MLSTLSYSSTGHNGEPTLTISGAYLQIDSGSGSTGGAINGLAT